MLVVKGSVLDSIITEKYIGGLIINTAHFLLPQFRRFLLRYIGPPPDGGRHGGGICSHLEIRRSYSQKCALYIVNPPMYLSSFCSV
jgi:hypothetical protein